MHFSPNFNARNFAQTSLFTNFHCLFVSCAYITFESSTRKPSLNVVGYIYFGFVLTSIAFIQQYGLSWPDLEEMRIAFDECPHTLGNKFDEVFSDVEVVSLKPESPGKEPEAAVVLVRVDGDPVEHPDRAHYFEEKG
jgi:hypothetical protein